LTTFIDSSTDKIRVYSSCGRSVRKSNMDLAIKKVKRKLGPAEEKIDTPQIGALALPESEFENMWKQYVGKQPNRPLPQGFKAFTVLIRSDLDNEIAAAVVFIKQSLFFENKKSFYDAIVSEVALVILEHTRWRVIQALRKFEGSLCR